MALFSPHHGCCGEQEFMHVTHTSVLISRDCPRSLFNVFGLIMESEGILLGPVLVSDFFLIRTGQDLVNTRVTQC